VLRGSDSATLDLADGSGRPVASVGAVVLRPVTAAQVKSAQTRQRQSLYRVDLIPAASGDGAGDHVVVDVAAFDDGDADIAVAARRVVDKVLAVIRDAATDSPPCTFVVPGPLTERGLAF